MGDLKTNGAGLTLADKALVTDRPPSQAARLDGDDPPHLDTPLLPASLPHEGNRRATLTVLTGLQAGQLTAVDGAAVTIGRAANADLVVDETGVSRHHARIARDPSGAFYVEDLGSTNGTFVGTERVGHRRRFALGD